MSNEILDLLILIFAALVMPAMSARAGMRLARATPSSLVPRYWSAILRGGAAAIFLLVLWWFCGRPFAALGLDIPVSLLGQWGFFGDAVFIAFILMQQQRLSRMPEEDVSRLVARIAALRIAPRTRAELSVFFLLSITAGLWEELLYRGFLIGYLTPHTGLVAALVLSSAIFGVGHIYQGWRGVLTTATIGLLFAGLYTLSRSLWWLMLAHALVDISGGLVAYRIAARTENRGTVKVNSD